MTDLRIIAGSGTSRQLPGLPLTVEQWPAALMGRIAALMLLLLLFLSMELPIFIHDPRVSGSQISIVVLSSVLAVAAWLASEVKSARYVAYSLDTPRAWFYRELLRLPPILVSVVAATYAIRYGAFALSGHSYDLRASLVLLESLKFAVLFCCWIGIVFGVLSFVHMRQRTENLLQLQKTLAEARLSQLQAQLRPHFLFNALNTISAFMHIDVPRADRLLSLLGDLLRSNLNSSDRNLVPLREELALLRQYLDIMLARFGDRVSVAWDVSEDALAAPVPTMLLQPLLENAFKHGVERSSVPQIIQLRVRRAAQRLQITIFNTGSSLAVPWVEGLGLRNCRERLGLLYGETASLTLEAQPQGGVQVQVDLPCAGVA